MFELEDNLTMLAESLGVLSPPQNTTALTEEREPR
jgi:hypothetical protein